MPDISDEVIYIGPNEKFKGITGEIVKTREDNNAPFLVQLEKIREETGNKYKYWSKPENIIPISNIVEE